MGLIERILTSKKPKLWEHFKGLRERPTPPDLSVAEAYLKGLQLGYGEGLIQGVDLGLDVGLSQRPPCEDPTGWVNN